MAAPRVRGGKRRERLLALMVVDQMFLCTNMVRVQKEKDGRVKRRQGAKGCQTTEATDCFDWAAQMHELMDEVEGRLKQLHLVWHYFMRDGRYQFFPEHHLRRYISSIHNDFADLNQTLQDLQKLHRECRFYSQHVVS